MVRHSWLWRLNFEFSSHKLVHEGIFGAFGAIASHTFAAAFDAFRPDLVLVSAGFDSRMGDPLGDFRLTDDDFAELTGIVRGIAERHCSGRLVSTLEGGYALDGLASAAAAHVRALAG
jgi:acetoin utilization deacetylase AcuC-like enzyme